MSVHQYNDAYAWWSALRHEGLILDESRLRVLFPAAPVPLSPWNAGLLRKALVTFQATPDDTAARTALISHLLEDTIGLNQNTGGTWYRGTAVPSDLSHRSITGENIKPQHLWSHPSSPTLPVFTSPVARLGVGHGKRTGARVVEWMRAKSHSLALLTNGHQWRLIYAHGDSSAWCESDSTQWFLEGEPAPQLDALRLLLDPRVLVGTASDATQLTSPLLATIEASRRGQSELSAILGERVRLAVEKFIASHGPAFLVQTDAPARQDIYVAACRIVLRLVFTLFAEARDLLPRGNPIYWHSYSLGGLLEQLLRAGAGSGRERLRHRFSAWPRLVALGRLVHAGSPHEALPLLPYGGELFSPGQPNATDGISRALATFESACFDSAHEIMPDSEVLEILTLITRTHAVIRQGRGRTTVTVPVDFSDLSSEYIGILYEGLLDYELRCVSEDEAAVLFLAIGHEPALPLARLEQMKDEELKGLVDAFKKAAKAPAGEGEGDGDEAEESSEEEAEAEEEPTPEEEVPADQIDQPDSPAPAEILAETSAVASVREAARARALAWARRAVECSGLVPRPRGRRAAVDSDHELRLATTARRFIGRLLLPGEWYLIRWGGTRKGSGSFYTRPGLATPTIRRTLEPLVYERRDDGSLEPRSPQDILALKTCDPSCGSGTFPVGALRYLTEALFQSVFHHGWLVFGEDRQADGTTRLVIKPGPTASTQPVPAVLESLLKEVRLRAIDDESRLRAWLKRLVVENCLYGVDLDPLAIELARLALWVETMDPTLPFSFLDHKFRFGNGLVGAWIDTFQHYPVMAWHREGGDKNHTNFHHHFREKTIDRGARRGQTERVGDAWTEAIKQYLDNTIRPALHSAIAETTGTATFAFIDDGYTPGRVQDESLARFADIHRQLTDPEAQRSAYQKWCHSYAFMEMRDALDLWCALWFWPADQLHLAPGPREFLDPPPETKAVVRALRNELRFFHWELEFPDVFNAGSHGFHALLGNPPWEIQKPNSKEFFSNVDPLYRTYGKQAAIAQQSQAFAHDPSVEESWLRYNARLKALGHFTKHTAYPFGDPAAHHNEDFHFTIVPRRAAENDEYHTRWRSRRKPLAGFADSSRPFRYQGSADINTYKLFTEQAHALLRPGGRLGFILPSGIYSDKGSASLRRLFLDHCRWEWCFGFENREKIFDIDSRFKFIALIVEKGGKTEAIRTAFMRRAVDDWDRNAESIALDYPRDLVTKLSPYSTALVEIRDPRDVAILDRMYSRGVLLGDQSERGWGLKYGTDFHMANDSRYFPHRSKWLAAGFQQDEFGFLLKGAWKSIATQNFDAGAQARRIKAGDAGSEISIDEVEDFAVPLYQGGMIWQFDSFAAAYVGGSGQSIAWQDLPLDKKLVSGQYLLRSEDVLKHSPNCWKPRVILRSVQNAANQRTLIATPSPGFPIGHSLAYLRTDSTPEVLLLTAVLSSFPLDWAIRPRMSQANLSWFILSELPIVTRDTLGTRVGSVMIQLTASLSLTLPIFSRQWLKLGRDFEFIYALTVAERIRSRCILDALVCHLFGLNLVDFSGLRKI